MSIMFENTYSSGNDHNIYWKIGNQKGNSFEKIIYEYIKMLYKGNEKVHQIEKTPVVNDGGKDIVLTFEGESLTLFGINFKGKSTGETIIYIECKSTDKEKLRREKFYPSTDNVIHEGKKIDFFVLLTNSKILAIDHFYISEDLKRIGAKFILIDQYIIARQWKNDNYNGITNFPCYDGDDFFYHEYQVYLGSNANSLVFYFVFRNYSAEPRKYTHSLLTNLNWFTDSHKQNFIIPPYDSYTYKIELKYDNKTDYQGIEFSVFDGVDNHHMVIEESGLSKKYIPKFIGNQHNKVVDTIHLNLTSVKPDNLFCLWGSAGVGKSRIISELEKKIRNNSYYDIFNCTLKINNKYAIKKIVSFLKEKEYLANDVSNDICNFKDAILSCSNKINTALIIIDDFHNSSKEFIDQIKLLNKYSAPVRLILCGRTDYSAGNTDYYGFVEWTVHNLTKEHTVWDIKPLEPKETMNFIRGSIQNVPDAVYDSLFENSQNNPLYIVQYVQLLLDEKIAYLESENTISVYTHKMISALPQKINDIYEKRIKFVKKTGSADKRDYLMFLLILTMYNGQFSRLTAHEFDPDNSRVRFLLDRQFVRTMNDNYIFEHESIHLFLKDKLMQDHTLRKKLGKEMLSHKAVISNYPIYTMARLFYWTDKNDLALKTFQPIIDIAQKDNNLSNISIDTSIYDYIDDVLDIIKNRDDYKDVARQLLNKKIYITLHHFIPINAVRDCNRCLKYISHSSCLKNDKILENSIFAQKAHALLNSGMNFEGMLQLNELQSRMMMNKSEFDNKSLFEIIDRLCAIYIKFNCYSIAQNYSDLEVKIATEYDNASLASIAFRTRSKLYYLQNHKLCIDSLDMVDKYLQKSPSLRIELNNKIYRNIANLSYVDLKQDSSSIDDTIKTAEQAQNNKLNRAYIQSHLLLAAMYLKRGEKGDLQIAEGKAKIALDYSVRFGIPSYLWQIYNITAIIYKRLRKSKNEINRQFESAFDVLRAQNLLFIGKKDLCYSNMLAICNFAFYLRKNFTQDIFNSRMSQVSYFSETDMNESTITLSRQTAIDKESLDHLYKKANSNMPCLLFGNRDNIPLLRDDKTGYFIALT